MKYPQNEINCFDADREPSAWLWSVPVLITLAFLL